MPHASRLLDYASRGLIVKRKEPPAALSGVLVDRWGCFLAAPVRQVHLELMSTRLSALPVLLVVLTITTGLIDAVSALGLGRVFTANMTVDSGYRWC